MSFIATDSRMPRVFIIDENEIHLSHSFGCQPAAAVTQIIIRMPPVPVEYLQVARFSAWYENRLRALNAYAAAQNAQCRDGSVRIEVRVGSKHDVLLAFRAQLEAVAMQSAMCAC